MMTEEMRASLMATAETYDRAGLMTEQDRRNLLTVLTEEQ